MLTEFIDGLGNIRRVCVCRNLKYYLYFCSYSGDFDISVLSQAQSSFACSFLFLTFIFIPYAEQFSFPFFFYDLLKTKTNKQKSKTPKTLLFTTKQNHPDIFLNINIFMKNLLPPVKITILSHSTILYSILLRSEMSCSTLFKLISN